MKEEDIDQVTKILAGMDGMQGDGKEMVEMKELDP